MDEPKVRPGPPGDRSQAAAEKLRALRERADQALEGHRSRLGELETQLSERVRRLAEEFGAALAPVGISDPAREEELAVLRRQVDETNAKHERFNQQLAEARKRLDEIRTHPCASCQQAAEQLAAAQHEMQQLRDQLADAARQHEEERARHEKFIEQLAAARQAIQVLQRSEGAAVTELRAELESARAAQTAVDEQLAAAQRDLESLHIECDAVRSRSEQHERELASSQGECSRLVAQLAVAEQACDDAERRCVAADAERQALAAALAAHELTNAEQASAIAEQQRLAQQLAATEAELSELRSTLEQAHSTAMTGAQSAAEASAELAAARRELAELRSVSASSDDLEAVRRECRTAEAAIAELQQALAAAQAAAAQADAEAAAVRDASRSVAEFTELQDKFDLALADVQKLKRENSGLREDLAQRPAASDLESPELIALRSERDALAARVGELEATAAATPAIDLDARQEHDDLQRRFEMAVDDVRHLKQENAQLRDKLAAMGGSGGGEPEAGGDWAAQKARLMAMLEEEDQSGPIAADRVAERASVAKTIAATDRIIADKEHEIAELRSALETRGAIADEASSVAAVAEREQILNADEVVAVERQRLAKLTAEWEGKLRAAELEFSVERAKLAREQAALREKALELASGVAHHEAGGEPGKPRRRWLSALGLGEDGDDPKKR